jgi:hypothetical protein
MSKTKFVEYAGVASGVIYATESGREICPPDERFEDFPD